MLLDEDNDLVVETKTTSAGNTAFYYEEVISTLQPEPVELVPHLAEVPANLELHSQDSQEDDALIAKVYVDNLTKVPSVPTNSSD
jgi:hypothetical protein